MGKTAMRFVTIILSKYLSGKKFGAKVGARHLGKLVPGTIGEVVGLLRDS
jgi:hypothetical protein